MILIFDNLFIFYHKKLNIKAIISEKRDDKDDLIGHSNVLGDKKNVSYIINGNDEYIINNNINNYPKILMKHILILKN